MRSISGAIARTLAKLEVSDEPVTAAPPAKGRRPRVTQPILGLVAPAGRAITPSQREMVRRAGTYLSIQQQRQRRRERG